ncbi:Zn finger-containing GTPase- Activating Protein for ARF [Ascosphaera acerosa]|nr:Zn finger-containing GTPase- Activating Protein for ARF [Ascosphaera acerosa]
MTTFPRLGTRDDFSRPSFPVSGPALRSQFVPDQIANPHIRFPTLAANIRHRRGRKVALNVPVFRDTHTPWPFRDPTVDYDRHTWAEDDDVRNGAAKDGCVYMDAMAFGMGSCCLQITFQCENIAEARTLYDALLPLGPIMLALTAGTPIYKGFLVDTDVRWNQIGASVDCRTREELGEAPLRHDRWRIPKSRYASNSTYIAAGPRLRPEYQDPELVVDEAVKRRLMDGGMDAVLATHFAHLFIRDPIVVFEEDLEHLDLDKTDHFENLQSTNWQHIRFKPPPADNDGIGWRVEFRPMEIQMTDFENAAFSIFMVLITRAILSFDLNFYIPIQKVTENMDTAHARDAVRRRVERAAPAQRPRPVEVEEARLPHERAVRPRRRPVRRVRRQRVVSQHHCRRASSQNEHARRTSSSNATAAAGAPAASTAVLRNARSSRTGRPTRDVAGGSTYSWTTSALATAPVLRTLSDT